MKILSFSIYNTKMRNGLFVLLSTLFFMNFNSLYALSSFQCPDDITIGCCTDYTNTDITGHPGDFNQGYSHFSYEDEVHLSECREGYVIRTWTGHVGGIQYSCEQVITMEYIDDFDGNIHWPPHWEGYCGDEIPYFEPDYDRGFCDMIAHTYNDDTLRFVGNVCMKILRNWKVVDWCKYVPNSPDKVGVWEYTQVFKIRETSKPVLNACTGWDVKARNSDCTADAVLYKSATDDNCDYTPILNWRIEFDLNNDWSVDSIADKSGLSGDTISFELKKLPIGEHKVTWKVSDRCGNVRQCMEIIYVEDGKAPTPYCYLSMPLVLMPQGNMLEVNANIFMKQAEDNCTAEDDLFHSWSTDPADSIRVFDCDDTGFQFLPVYTIDEAGNTDFCFIFSNVTAHGNCSGSNLVEGMITDFNDSPVQDVKINLGRNPFQLHCVDTTGENGQFAFPYIETSAEPDMYFRSDIKNDQISTQDMVVLNNYLLGLIMPQDLKNFKIAADVNADGKLNTLDLLAMRSHVLGIDNEPFEGYDFTNHLKVFIPDPEDQGKYLEVDSVRDFSNIDEVKVIRIGDLESYLGR
jgi:hypothetical protein